MSNSIIVDITQILIIFSSYSNIRIRIICSYKKNVEVNSLKL